MSAMLLLALAVAAPAPTSYFCRSTDWVPSESPPGELFFHTWLDRASTPELARQNCSVWAGALGIGEAYEAVVDLPVASAERYEPVRVRHAMRAARMTEIVDPEWVLGFAASLRTDVYYAASRYVPIEKLPGVEQGQWIETDDGVWCGLPGAGRAWRWEERRLFALDLETGEEVLVTDEALPVTYDEERGLCY